LRSHDVFNLKLPAELIALSACETGLGKDVRGEGLVGLTRGFMYAKVKQMIEQMPKGAKTCSNIRVANLQTVKVRKVVVYRLITSFPLAVRHPFHPTYRLANMSPHVNNDVNYSRSTPFDRSCGPTNCNPTANHFHTADGHAHCPLSTTDAFSHACSDGQVVRFSRAYKHSSTISTAIAVACDVH
jgi:hypothetical protein